MIKYNIFDKILTDRHYNNWPSWQIVYEWEDEISKGLQLPIENSPGHARKSVKGFAQKVGRKILKNDGTSISRKISEKEKFLYFEMLPKGYNSFSNHTSAFPVIIDFWKKDRVGDFKKYYENSSHLLVTSLEVIHFLEQENFQGKLVHFPMSIPDKYRISGKESFEKKYDVILAGRTNPVLLKFFEQYKDKHPNLEYVYRAVKNGKFSYYSNKTGFLGDFKDREAYANLLSRSKVAFYSTPGMDGGEERTGGFNPITPRIFEILAAGCKVIMRYPENAETQFFKLQSLAPSAGTYNEFEAQLTAALREPAPIAKNAAYLNNHYTSGRVEILKSLS